MSKRVVAILVAVALVGTPAPSSGQAESKAYVGRALVDVLKELQTSSLKLIFSSELVPPSLRVTKEPKGTEPQKIALQVLEPHGLTLREAPGGTFIVVKRRQAPAAPKPAPADSGPSGPAPTDDDKKPLRVEERCAVL